MRCKSGPVKGREDQQRVEVRRGGLIDGFNERDFMPGSKPDNVIELGSDKEHTIVDLKKEEAASFVSKESSGDDNDDN